jgi:hypothetical protein
MGKTFCARMQAAGDTSSVSHKHGGCKPHSSSGLESLASNVLRLTVVKGAVKAILQAKEVRSTSEFHFTG